MCRNAVAMWMAAHLQYLLKPLKVVALKKIPFSNTQNPKTVCWPTDCPWQADNLTQPIQMPLYQKQKSFSEFFSCISKIYIKF